MAEPKFSLKSISDLVRQASAWQTAGALVCGLGAVAFLKLVVKESIVSWQCRHIPCPKGRLPLLGHALELLK